MARAASKASKRSKKAAAKKVPAKTRRKRAGASSGKTRAAAAKTQAAQSDRHRLYQQAVQSVDAEVDFVDDTFKELRGRLPTIIREDFCGTANTSCEFVRRRPGNRAIGVDLCADTLAWGIKHNLAKLTPKARERVTLALEDVCTVAVEPVDVVLAMNFSYFIFKERALLRAYFANVLKGLAPGGMFIVDFYGGADAFKEMREKRDIDGKFTYVWDQARYEPISGNILCHIHFHFPDGSKIQRAFSYDWRMWTMPEIREIMAEAGFARSTVYWEGTDEDTDEGDGVFVPADQGEADLAWIAYVVAEK